MSTTATARRTFSPRAVAAFAAVTIVLPHVPSFFHRLLDGDEAIYGSIAALMNMGGPLYAEGGVDNKPPGIFWVYSATFRVFGTYQMTAIHVVALLAVIATALLIFLVGRHVGSTRAGVLAAVFYGVLTGAGNPRLLAANTEVFMMLPLTASLLLMLRRRWLWSGLLLAAAGSFRQSAAIDVVLLALTGSLSGFWRWTVGSLTQYAGTNWTPAVIWGRAQDSLIPFLLDMVVLWLAAIAWALRWRRLDPGQRLIVAWLVVSVIGSLAGGPIAWHYFIQVMGALAMLAAFAIDSALRSPLKKQVAAIVAIGVAVPAIAWAAYDVTADPLTYDWSPPIAQHQLVADYIHDHTRPGDRVFVWGDWAALYVEADRPMASRFPGFLRGFDRGSGLPPNNWDTAPDVWPELQADLQRHPPALIVDTAAAGWSDFGMYPMRNYPVLRDLVGTKYRLV